MTSVVGSQPRTLANYPCELADIPGRGRALIAARDVGAGEVVLRSERMGTSLRVKHEQYWCVECLRHLLPDWSQPLPAACDKCQCVWTCQECRESPAFLWRHAVMCKGLQVARKQKNLKTEQRRMLRLLLTIVSTHAYESQFVVDGGDDVRALCPDAVDERCSSGNEDTIGVTGRAGATRHPCFIQDFLCMQAHTPGAKDAKMFAGVATLALSVLEADVLSQLERLASRLGYAKAHALLVALLERDRVNVFNLSNASGEDCGECHFPAAAFANHSCLPNVQVKIVKGHVLLIALHDIARFQEIVHSYVPIKAGRSRAELQDSMARAWDFTCTCLRCQRPRSKSVKAFDEAFLCSCGSASRFPYPKFSRAWGDADRDTQGVGVGAPSGGSSEGDDSDVSRGILQMSLGDRGLVCFCNVHNLLA